MNTNSSMHQHFDLGLLAGQVMTEMGFSANFSQQIIHDVNALQPPIIDLTKTEREDLRHLLWFSLDNDDSRDLDQLTFAESLPGGKYKIYVAVAYVDELVKIGDSIDFHAARNTTSVYTPARNFPMLPERLSTDLTSLNPGEDRSAVVFKGVLSSDYELEDFSVSLAYVHSYAKLCYNSVSDWLDGIKEIPDELKNQPLADQLRLQDEIAQKVAVKRHSSGALSVETIETHPVFVDGVPVSLQPLPMNRGRVLIENFMIIANTISAKFSEQHNIPILRRVVVVPKRWDKIVDIAKKYHTTLPNVPDPVSLEKFVAAQKLLDPVTFPDLSLSIIKLLGNGEYRISLPGKPSPGHFGLALRDYSHSTAPNRRFPDLMTQRLLLSVLKKQPLPYSYSDLETLSEHCTLKEDEAQKIERRMRKSAAAMFLSNSIGKEYDGMITGVNDSGTWVRIFNPPVEGKLVKNIDNVDVGDRVHVKLHHTDIVAGFIDFVEVQSERHKKS